MRRFLIVDMTIILRDAAAKIKEETDGMSSRFSYDDVKDKLRKRRMDMLRRMRKNA